MAFPSRIASRSGSALLRQVALQSTAARRFTTRSSTSYLYATTQKSPVKSGRNIRLFSSSVAVRSNQTQTAPSAEAYLKSGVIKGAANPVNVKKVLVIGSGGLSIGQAGEFDYSGKWVNTSCCWGMSPKTTFLGQPPFVLLLKIHYAEWLTLFLFRLASSQGTQRGWCFLCPHQSQYCNYPNRPRPH